MLQTCWWHDDHLWTSCQELRYHWRKVPGKNQGGKAQLCPWPAHILWSSGLLHWCCRWYLQASLCYHQCWWVCAEIYGGAQISVPRYVHFKTTTVTSQRNSMWMLLQLYCSLYQIDPYTRTLYLVVYPLLLDNLFWVLIFSSTVIISNPMYHCDFRGHHSDTPGSSGPSESSERNDQRWTHES